MPEQNQNIPTPPGYSDADVVKMGAGNIPLPPGYSADQIMQQPSQASASKSGASAQEPSTMGGVEEESFLKHPIMSTLEHASNMGTDVIKGAEGSVAGISDLINKIPGVGETLAPKEGIAAMNAQSSQLAGNGLDKLIGYGGENLIEFLAGDEALKGLSLADRLAKSAKIAKMLENSPKLMRALQFGAAVTKETAQLGPEEQALLKSQPLLARALLRAGVNAGHAAAVQTALTAAKTQGGAKERAGAAVKEGAGMGAGAAIIGAPLEGIGAALSRGAEAAKTAQAMTEEASKAPGQIDITEQAQTLARNAERTMHDRYEKGVQDMSHWLGGAEMDYEGSPLHKAAQSLAEQGVNEEKPLDAAFSQTRPGSKGANKMVDMLANPGGEEEAAEEGAAAPKAEGLETFEPQAEETPKEPQEPIKLDVNELIERRQLLGERMRSLGFVTAEDRADREIYGKLIQGIDDSIKQLGDESGNPRVSQRLEQINTEYRQQRALMKNKDVQSLLKGNVGDIAARLARGETARDDIDAVRKFIGDHNMGSLGDGIMQRWIADATADGKFDPEKLLKQWNKVKPEVRNELFGLDDPKNTPQFRDWFGKSKATDFKGNPKVLYHGTRTPIDFDEFSVSGAPPAEDELHAAADNGSGSDPTAYMGAHFAETPKTANMFAEGKGWTSAKVDPEVAKGRVLPVYLKAEKPMHFGPEEKLHDFINEGKTTDDLYLEDAMHASGVNPEDDKAAAKWDERYENDTNFRRKTNEWIRAHARLSDEPHAGQGVAQELAEQARERLKKMGYDSLTYDNQVEGGKAWVALEPEQIKSAIGNSGAYDKASGSLTDAGKEAAKQNYEQVIGKVKDLASFKKLVKYGVIAPTVAAGATATGASFGPIGALIGFLAGSGADSLAKVSGLLDYVADHPLLWKGIEASQRPAAKAVGNTVNTVSRYGAGRATGKVVSPVYNAVANALGGHQ